MRIIVNFFKSIFKTQPEEPIASYSTSQVYKISGVPEYTFIDRDLLTEEIDEYLETKDGVLLFLGYSKSGKTVFRKNILMIIKILIL